jgi:hypothetical protein
MNRRALFTLVTAILSLVTVAVHDAAAACSASPGATSVALARAPLGARPNLPFAIAPDLPFAATSAAQSAVESAGLDKITKNAADGIVGLWFTVFKVDGETLNRGFQLYIEGGTEMSIDDIVPPALGNVCVGVWKRIAPRVYKLRHVTFAWNPDGSKAGTFLQLTTVRLDPDGRNYSGTFVWDNFDTNNQPIPELHAEGTLTGRRITVD